VTDHADCRSDGFASRLEEPLAVQKDNRALLFAAAKILPDGNPQKIPRMGTLSGIGHPPLSEMAH
jgi:hypothetical protein